MKTIILAIGLMFSATAFAGGADQEPKKNLCDEAATGKDCEVVKVLTRCDVEKYKLQKRIEKLQRELKELESRKETVRETVVEKVVEVPVVVEKKVTKTVVKKETKIKKHIVSLFAHRAVTSSGTSSSSGAGTRSARAEVGTEYVPGLMYQYQFDMGLVPMLGVDTELNPILGLGFEF